MSTPNVCPAGGYCPAGSASPRPCPVGTFAPQGGLKNITECTPCPVGQFCDTEGLSAPSGLCEQGYFCDGSSITSVPVFALEGGGLCPKGFYCPSGTRHAFEFPCPRGTFNNQTGQRSAGDCTPCSPGFFCETLGLISPSGPCASRHFCLGGVSTRTPNASSTHLGVGGLCPLGHACPEGTAFPVPCQEGTISDIVGNSECRLCPAGFQCVRRISFEGTSDGVYVMDECSPGHWCPTGTGTDAQLCPRGTYSSKTGLMSSDECTSCDAGRYCPVPGASSLAEAQSNLCTAGYFCAAGVDVATPEANFAGVGGPCPAGYYCEQGTAVPTPCPPGTFSNSTRLVAADACIKCLPGHYCAEENLLAPSGLCDLGYFCIRGSNTARPVSISNVGDICPAGFTCSIGSSSPSPCFAGTYNKVQGQSDCTTCPAGFFCPEATENFEFNPCPEGHFCPPGTQFGEQFACPPGTFNDVLGAESEQDCFPCLPGMYCGFSGLSAPTGPCDAGWFCQRGSSSNRPMVNSSNPTLCPFVGVGGICPLGSYCPAASIQPIPCEPGRFCSSLGLNSSTGDCAAGFLCYSGASTPTPTDGITGEVCPPGFFCPSASSQPTPCPIGTFSNQVGAINSDSCELCPVGHACPQPATIFPQPCMAGYFCNTTGEVSTSPANKLCPLGHFCPKGTINQKPCPSGTFQSAPGQENCQTCPSSYVCDATLMPIIDPYLIPCPAGFYCPIGTRFASEHPCPPGTFSDVEGLGAEEQCQTCLPGFYCETPALTTSTGPCAAGYYCSLGAKTAQPTDGITGAICPQGSFCPLGSSNPIPCPLGSATEEVGAADVSACLLCPPGQFCTSGSPPMDCDGGYVCVQGATAPQPTQFTFNPELNQSTGGYICPAGHYCPQGTPVKIPCELYTYQPSPGQSACLPCPAGQTCAQPGTLIPVDCPAGSFCEEASPSIPCPNGSYGPIPGLRNSDECKTCPAGMFCTGLGEIVPTGSCAAGYLCPMGQSSATPSNHRCPAGHFCESGTTSATPCSPGSFRTAEQGESIADCAICTPGFYCFSFGLTSPTSPCSEGYFCPEGVANALPSPSNFECPRGSFCPPGSPAPVVCPDGTFQDQLRQAHCKMCPPGYFCNGGADAPSICPEMHYCPANSSHPIVCPNGTYNLNQGITGEDNLPFVCPPCPTGKYCLNGRIEGNCAAGYFCVAGSSSPTPHVLEGSARLCDPGHFCPAGTLAPIPCPSRTFREFSGAEQLSQCSTCPAGSTCGPATVSPVLCPSGYYCLEGEDPLPCPIGTFNNETGAANALQCLQCPAGFICEASGISSFKIFPCIPDHFCPQGVDRPMPCPVGTRFNGTGLGSQNGCMPCPGGFRCPSMVNDRMQLISCSAGTFCPEGSTQAIICPGGFFCPAQSVEAHICPGSHFCPPESKSPTPCLPSFFCPEGSSTQRQCPPGYRGNPNAVFDLNDLASVSTACAACPEGTFAMLDEFDMVQCIPCPPSYFCPFASGVNATTARVNCNVQVPTYVFEEERLDDVTLESSYYCACPQGYFCPSDSILPTPCPPGTFNDKTGSTSIGACQPCPVNSYNSLSGQPACRPCGSSAFSAEGSITCECIGANRVFSTDDGECTCISRFVYFDELNKEVSEGDGREACQPETLPPCAQNEVIFGNRMCIRPSNRAQVESICEEECRGRNNVAGINQRLGTCECRRYLLAEDVCNSTCRSEMAYLQCSSDGTLQLRSMQHIVLDSFDQCEGLRGTCAPGARITPTALETVDNSTTIVGVFANRNYWYQMCGVVPSFGVQRRHSRHAVRRIRLDGHTIFTPLFFENDSTGSFNITMRGRQFQARDAFSNITAQHSQLLHETLLVSTKERVRRNSIAGIPVSASLPNPLICISVNSAVSFPLSRSTNPPSFPRYEKDHLLNTNPSFDFGAFRSLATVMLQSTSAVSTFVHTFQQSGMYVFYDNARPNSRIFIRVMEEGNTCEDNVLPATSQNLQLAGASKASVEMEPNMTVIGAILGAFGVLIVALSIFLSIYRPARWAADLQSSVRPQYITKGAVSPYLLSAADGKLLDRVRYEPKLLENLTVKELFQHLDDYSSRVNHELLVHDTQIQEQLAKIRLETEELHHMVKDMDVDELKDSLRAIVEASSALTSAQQERMAQKAAKEAQLLDQVNALLRRLGSRVRVEDALVPNQKENIIRRRSHIGDEKSGKMSKAPAIIHQHSIESTGDTPINQVGATSAEPEPSVSQSGGNTDLDSSIEDQSLDTRARILENAQHLLSEREEEHTVLAEQLVEKLSPSLDVLGEHESDTGEEKAIIDALDITSKELSAFDQEDIFCVGSEASKSQTWLSPQEASLVEGLVRSQLRDKFEEIPKDSEEYLQAQAVAEGLVLRARREAAQLVTDGAKGSVALDKADIDKERLVSFEISLL